MADAADSSEKLSKNELKRRQKAEKKAAEKAEKEKAKATEAAAKENSGEPEKKTNKVTEEDISPNEYFRIRSLAVEELKTGPNHPYPHKFHVNISLTEFIEKYHSLEDGTTKEEGNKLNIFVDPLRRM